MGIGAKWPPAEIRWSLSEVRTAEDHQETRAAVVPPLRADAKLMKSWDQPYAYVLALAVIVLGYFLNSGEPSIREALVHRLMECP